MTLRELWEQKRLSPTELAGQARISVPTLYKINRKEPVREGNIKAVCRVLDITRDQFNELEKDNA